MTYQQTLAHIYSLGRFGIKPGIERISLILDRLGNPQDAFSSVHLVGTNGKGSTASFLSSILSAAGYRTGLFTSPHLISFTERMRVDGVEIGEDAVVELAQRVLDVAPPEATFFEIVTALAVLHFAAQKVDIAVFEAGMGGRLDATNALSGILTVVTPVSLEHREYLGESIAEIAAEKAGIVKNGTALVCARQPAEAATAIEAEARSKGALSWVQGPDFDSFWEGGELNYTGHEVSLRALKPGVPGRYQAGNAACALAAAELLSRRGFPVTPEAMAAGVARASWPGRMELFPGSPRVMLDGAHNPAGAAALAESLADVPRGRLFLVAGVMADKELSGILSPLLPLAKRTYAVAPSIDRALPAADLCRFCRESGYHAEEGGTVERGLSLAQQEAAADDLVLVCGSLFTVGEARSILLSRGFEPFRG